MSARGGRSGGSGPDGSQQPRGVGRALFRLTLRLLPGEFRERAGAEMEAICDARMREAAGRGRVAMARVWASEVGGSLIAGCRARVRVAPFRARARGHGWSAARDLRFSLRTLRRRPGLAALAILTCGVGIGSASAMFSVVDGVLLKPLGYPDSDRVMSIYPTIEEWRETSLADVADRASFSQPEFLAWRERQTSFTDVTVVGAGGRYLEDAGAPDNVQVGWSTPGLWGITGATPALGRLPTEEDGRPGSERVAVLSHAVWRDRFAGDDVIGRRLRLSGEAHTIVGVLPRDFRVHWYDAEIWVPLDETPDESERGNHNFRGLGTLAPGVDIERAQAETATIMGNLSEAHDDITHLANVLPHVEDVTRDVRLPLQLLVFGSLALLAAACFNFAALLLGAGIDRERELAVRGALGAGRRRLARLLVSESMALALAGCVLGVGLAFLISKGLVLLAPPDVPRIEEVAVDARAVAFALGAALVAGLGFGLVPAWSLSRTDVADRLRSRVVSRDRSRLHGALVLTQIALATVLLVGAGLFVRTLVYLERVDPGLDTDVLTVNASLPFALVPADPEGRRDAWRRFDRDLLATIEAVPGIEAVARTSVLPFSGQRGNNDIELEGYEPAPGEEVLGQRRFVSGRYMSLMGFRALHGRLIGPEDDHEGAEPVAVVSRRLAEHAWPDGSALGRHLEFWAGRFRIVGVVDDVHDSRLEDDADLRFYVAYGVTEQTGGSLVLRIAGDVERWVAPVSAAIRAAHPRVPRPTVLPMRDLVRRTLADRRYRARLAGAFGLFALFFATAGIYGVVSRRVGLRRHEIGVRVAIGASAPRVVGDVLRHGTALALGGVLIGLALAAAGSRAAGAYVYGISAVDPITFGGIAALLTAAALLASAAPSLRAARVDPIETLRGE